MNNTISNNSQDELFGSVFDMNFFNEVNEFTFANHKENVKLINNTEVNTSNTWILGKDYLESRNSKYFWDEYTDVNTIVTCWDTYTIEQAKKMVSLYEKYLANNTNYFILTNDIDVNNKIKEENKNNIFIDPYHSLDDITLKMKDFNFFSLLDTNIKSIIIAKYNDYKVELYEDNKVKLVSFNQILEKIN